MKPKLLHLTYQGDSICVAHCSQRTPTETDIPAHVYLSKEINKHLHLLLLIRCLVFAQVKINQTLWCKDVHGLLFVIDFLNEIGVHGQ